MIFIKKQFFKIYLVIYYIEEIAWNWKSFLIRKKVIQKITEILNNDFFENSKISNNEIYKVVYESLLLP